MTSLKSRLKSLYFPDEEFDADVRRTYVTLRVSVASIGLVLPIILVSSGLIHGIRWSDMTSLSAFYWLQLPGDRDPLLRDWFVGSLCAVGLMLVIYYGYGRLENRLLNLAGATLIVVALNPMAWPVTVGHQWRLGVHEVAAVIFFLLIAATIWFCADKTLLQTLDASVRRRWARIYAGFAIAMVAAPLIVLAMASKGHRVIVVEALGVWIFSGYWLAKTYELLKVSQVEPTGRPAPRLRWAGGELKVA